MWLFGNKLRFAYILAMTALINLSSMSCSNSGGGKKEVAAFDPATATPQSVNQPKNSQAPGVSVKLPSTVGLDATLAGVPEAYSSASSFEVNVEGSNIQQYRYQLLSGLNDCSQVTYGEWTDVNVPISGQSGADGSKILCVLVSGVDKQNEIMVGSISYRWIKDSVGPEISLNSLVGFGPFYTTGDETILAGTAKDDGSAIASLGISLQKDNAQCLNNALSAFDASCPNFLAIAVDGQEPWLKSTSDALFTSGSNYSITVAAMDQANNSSQITDSGIWDITPPVAASNLVVESGREQLSLQWNAGAEATKYLVLHRANAAVNTTLASGIKYALNQTLNGDNEVVYIGSSTNFIDNNLNPYIRYHYPVYAVDDAWNISGPATGSGFTTELPRFRGIHNAMVIAPDKTIQIQWLPFADGINDPNSYIYELYVATSPGGYNFNSAPAAVANGGSQLNFKYTGSANIIYLAVKARNSNGVLDSNTREFTLQTGSGSHHKLSNNNRFNGQLPLQSYLDNPWAIAKDSWGNLIFSADLGVVDVYCMENIYAPYCKGRTTNAVYTIAGTDGRGNSTNPVSASWAGIGAIYGIAIDTKGNSILLTTVNLQYEPFALRLMLLAFATAKHLDLTTWLPAPAYPQTELTMSMLQLLR